MMAGADLKSMSATHNGRTSRPEYFCHFCESVPRRSGTESKSYELIERGANHDCGTQRDDFSQPGWHSACRFCAVQYAYPAITADGIESYGKREYGARPAKMGRQP